MSTRTTVTAICDVPDEPGEKHGEARAIGFSLDGRHYEAEFCAGHELAFAMDLKKFIDAARPAGRTGKPAPGQRNRSTADRQRTAAIRQWAIGQGLDVGDRGRFPAGVVAMYNAEHNGAGTR